MNINKSPFCLRFSFIFAFLGTLASGFLPEHFWNGAYSPSFFSVILVPHMILYFSICIALTRLGINANPISNVSESDPYWRMPLLHGIGVVSVFAIFWGYGLVFGIILQSLIRRRKSAK